MNEWNIMHFTSESIKSCTDLICLKKSLDIFYSSPLYYAFNFKLQLLLLQYYTLKLTI